MIKIAILATYLCLTLAQDEAHVTLAPPVANKCDSKVIAAIKGLWGDNIPSNLISKSKAAGKESMVGTTHGYYPSEVDCVYSWSNDTSAMLTYVFKDGFVTYEMIIIAEHDGVILDKETGIKRYEVYSKGGVFAHYKCHDEGKDGDPEGVIKVRDSKFDAPSVIEAVRALDRVGITVDQVLSTDCPDIENTDDTF